MNKATYESMSREELRDYLRGDRNNSEAWEVFFDKLNQQKTKEKITLPSFNSLEELEEIISQNPVIKAKLEGKPHN
jgi:hypothetical protein